MMVEHMGDRSLGSATRSGASSPPPAYPPALVPPGLEAYAGGKSALSL